MANNKKFSDEEMLEKEVEELLNMANEKSQEVEQKFNAIVEQINKPMSIYRYKPVNPIYMDDIQDAVIAAMNVLIERKIVDPKDHGSRDVHDSLVMLLSDYFEDPNYKNHVLKTEKPNEQVNS